MATPGPGEAQIEPKIVPKSLELSWISLDFPNCFSNPMLLLIGCWGYLRSAANTGSETGPDMAMGSLPTPPHDPFIAIRATPFAKHSSVAAQGHQAPFLASGF